MKTKLNLETDVRIALRVQVDGVDHLVIQADGQVLLNGVVVGADQVLAEALLAKRKPAAKPRTPSVKPASKPSEADAPKRTRKSKKKPDPVTGTGVDFETPDETPGQRPRDPNPPAAESNL